MGLQKTISKYVLLMSLILTVCGENKILEATENGTPAAVAAILGIKELPEPFLENFCKQNATLPKDKLKIACIKWFEAALDHCENLLRVGKFQPPKILDPENAYEINSNLTIATNTADLSTLDCKFIIGRLAEDYIAREPEYELKNYKIKIFGTGLAMIWTSLAVGGVTFWFKKLK